MRLSIDSFHGEFWRHLSADGPAMAVSSALLFLLGLSQSGGWPSAWHLAELTGLGGAFSCWFDPGATGENHGGAAGLNAGVEAASNAMRVVRCGHGRATDRN